MTSTVHRGLGASSDSFPFQGRLSGSLALHLQGTLTWTLSGLRTLHASAVQLGGSGDPHGPPLLGTRHI